jgi:MFS family permease
VNSIWQFFLFYPIVAIGIALAGFLTIVTTVVNWFERRRSLALALYGAGFALGGLMVPLLVWYLNTFGWRSGAVASAVIVLVVVMPLSFLFHHRPGDVGETVDGLDPNKPLPPRPARATKVSKVHFTPAEAMRTRAFWFISLGHMTALLVVSVVLAHLALYLTEDEGITLQQAAFVIGALPLLQLAGQTAGGYLGDRYDKRLLSAGAMVAHVIALLLLAYGGFWAVALFIPLHGVAWGLRGPMMQALRADYFGATSFGQILGFSSLVVMVGTIVGPILAGSLNDSTGSYRLGFIIVAILASSGVVFFLLATPPDPPHRPHDEVTEPS